MEISNRVDIADVADDASRSGGLQSVYQRKFQYINGSGRHINENRILSMKITIYPRKERGYR
ncbi:hypothetical protein LC085_18365 [Bacillus tianshenii]|uniref:hypothetical protein n=1 Tax=Sutcliffiella tianshenii TaxID=1463404 RepID=UPI001CD268D3|nr:hypothetical protein [Bacillus tianshenii]MCA1321864.1 hypothetical protein [Bacillus tianshenii]